MASTVRGISMPDEDWKIAEKVAEQDASDNVSASVRKALRLLKSVQIDGTHIVIPVSAVAAVAQPANAEV